MGEAKNRKAATGSAAAPNLTREALDQLARDLIDKGLLIEAGFASLRAMAMAADAPPEQVHEMRMAFFAGAQHLFGSMMQALDPESEPTDADIQRMGRIAGDRHLMGKLAPEPPLPRQARARGSFLARLLTGAQAGRSAASTCDGDG